MDAFEQIVGTILKHDGYWVWPSYKVRLLTAEKHLIGRPSAPRWEIDIVAYKGAENKLLFVECKSFLDSGGVNISAFDGSNERFGRRFKIFNDPELRRVVQRRAVRQLRASGSCAARSRVQWCLATGKCASGRTRGELTALFEREGWLLWDEAWLGDRLKRMAEGSYENDTVAMTAKMLLRRAD